MMKRIFAALCSVIAVTGCVEQTPVVSGKRLFMENCAVCHGASGMGDGPLAASLLMPPSDLTQISVRNDGVFPRNHVISTIDGFARGDHFSGAMPEFGAKLKGRTVLMNTGDGVQTPTPEPLVALANYLEQLQTN